jgi:hypothetical protein
MAWLSEIRTFSFGANAGLRAEIALTLDNDFEQDTRSLRSAGTIDVSEMCSRFKESNFPGVTISSASPFGLKRFAGQPAILWRDTTAMTWWIATSNPKNSRSVLVHGACKETKTKVLWIASRDSAAQSQISTRMANRSVGPDSMHAFVCSRRVRRGLGTGRLRRGAGVPRWPDDGRRAGTQLLHAATA